VAIHKTWYEARSVLKAGCNQACGMEQLRLRPLSSTELEILRYHTLETNAPKMLAASSLDRDFRTYLLEGTEYTG